MTAQNTIIAGNSAGASADFVKVGSNFADQGGNLIGTSSSANSVINTGLVGIGTGALTPTYVPLPGSPALCAGVASSLATDQRGVARGTVYGTYTCYDTGAVQTAYSLGYSQQPSDVQANSSITPSPAVQLYENNVALPVPVTQSP